jgi:hypothetical protein
MNLSPSAVESNPGLVSDHEDDEDEDEARSEAASTTMLRHADFDDMDIQVADGTCSDLDSRKALSFTADSSCARGRKAQL